MKTIDESLLADLSDQARKSPRKRAHHNLHESLADPFHRLCIAAEPGTYMRTHRHTDKWELMVVLRGAMGILTFDDAGRVLERTDLRAGGPVFAYELPEGVWHAFTILAPGTALLEVKRGPYLPIPEGDSAVWAPAEGDPNAIAYAQWYHGAQPGETFN
jgi:cupin fold WbuC family metalloprotein